MSEDIAQPPRVLRLLHYLIKIKSFYANHLCKKNCLAGKLNSNPEPCFEGCDRWLDNFFAFKKEKYPADIENFVITEQQANSLPNEEKNKFTKAYSQGKEVINLYLRTLNEFLDDKIKGETKK